MFAPAFFSNDETLQFYHNIKAKILNIGKLFEDGADENQARVLSVIEEIDLFFARLHKPAIFDNGDPDNAVVKIESHFEHLCAVLESNGVAHANTLTTLAFYLRLDYFRKVNQPKK